MIDSPLIASLSGMPLPEVRFWRDQVIAGSGYRHASLPQKRRRPRPVVIPSAGLDRVLKQLRYGLEVATGYTAPLHVHGFVRGRDIRTNAVPHLDQDVVLKVDLKDFFGSITDARVQSALEDFDFDLRSARLVAQIACVNSSLAQGFSTSPILSNLAFATTDIALSQFAAIAGVRITRYVDDLVFSGSKHLVTDSFLAAVTDVLSKHSWRVNAGKTRFMRRGRPQFVTGLSVDDPNGPHIPRSMKRLLQREVHFAARFGIEDAHVHSPTPVNFARLNGWVHYAAYADPSFGIPLRERWREVAASRFGYRRVEDWDELLRDIEFPENW